MNNKLHYWVNTQVNDGILKKVKQNCQKVEKVFKKIEKCQKVEKVFNKVEKYSTKLNFIIFGVHD